MKPSKEIVSEIVSTVDQVFAQGTFVDKAIAESLRAHPKWNNFARRYFAETVYELVRWWRWYWHLAKLPSKDYLVPEAITEQQIWWLWGTSRLVHDFGLAPFPELKGLPKEEILQRIKSDAPPAVKASVPDWLYTAGNTELGKDWRDILKALNQSAEIHLRANTLRVTARDLAAILDEEDIEAESLRGTTDGLRLLEYHNVFTTKAFKDGLFEVQDAGSQRIAPFLDVAPGQRVIDACAGAGGKTLHLAALMKNKGRIIALDVQEWKLTELRRRAARAGADNIEVRLVEGAKSIKRLNESADRVLLDAPCSGLGAMRRNPGIRWKITPDDLQRLRELQQRLLIDYSRLVKPGGKLVYATCSVLPSENQQQVKTFLAANSSKWKLDSEFHIRPDRENADGFYAARLVRQS